MKALFLGGTGTISGAITRLLSEKGVHLTLLNRGNHPLELANVRQIPCDIRDPQQVEKALASEHYDVIADFICFTPEQAREDIHLFSGKTDQFIFISSASAYRKPNPSVTICESTLLDNPFWHYSQDKQSCEEIFLTAFRKDHFPVTIVRPSHTFAENSLPVPVHGSQGPWQIVRRMIDGKPVPVCGDGESVWAVLSSREFARAFVGLMGNPAALGEQVQITSEELLTWNQILRAEAQAFGGKYIPLYVPTSILSQSPRYDFYGSLLGDKSNSVIFCNEKLHRLVPGYRQEEMFHQAIARTAEYYRQNPSILKEDPEFDAFCDGLVAIMDKAGQAVREL